MRAILHYLIRLEHDGLFIHDGLVAFILLYIAALLVAFGQSLGLHP